MCMAKAVQCYMISILWFKMGIEYLDLKLLVDDTLPKMPDIIIPRISVHLSPRSLIYLA